MSKAAKVAYTPVGVVGGIVAGLVAKKISGRLWSQVVGQDAVPSPRDRETDWKSLLGGAAVQGVVYAVVKAAVDRAGAQAFYRWSGSWPGE